MTRKTYIISWFSTFNFYVCNCLQSFTNKRRLNLRASPLLCHSTFNSVIAYCFSITMNYLQLSFVFLLSSWLKLCHTQLVGCTSGIVDDFIQICDHISSGECNSMSPVEYMGNEYSCSILDENCACSETDISEEIVFLIDGAGRESWDQQNFFWIYGTTFWPETYGEKIVDVQKINDNVNFHFVIFGSTIVYDWEYTVGGTPPWDGVTEQPSALTGAYNHVNFCTAYDRAKEIFDNSDKVSRTIVYVAINTPVVYECDLADYDINFLMIKWGDEVDPDMTVYDTFALDDNGLHQCIEQTIGNYDWFPKTATDGSSVFRPWNSATADFVCAAGPC